MMPDFASQLAELKFNEQGLIPAIVQCASTKRVLMMAWMNLESLSKTIQLGETVFYSRSRQELWHKGEISGHTQKVLEIQLDCDKDTVLVFVSANGPACHTGSNSCFDVSTLWSAGKLDG